MSKTETNLCRNCGLSEETIEHLFFHCVKVKEFRSDLDRWIESLTGITCRFTIQEVLLGTIQFGNHSDTFNILLLIIRDYSFEETQKGSVFSITAFPCTLQEIHIEQEYLATINSQLPKFLRKWALVKELVQTQLANAE